MNNSSKLSYVPEFDGVRALAVFAVIATHTIPQAVPGGNIGVDTFFVLSGFLITRILINEFKETGHIGFINFYARRFLRLAPAFWLLLFVYVSVALIHGGVYEHNNLQAALSAGLYIMNWTRAFHVGQQGMLGHTWSLAIEEQFYLVMPLILSLALSKMRPGSVWKPILLLLILSGAERTFLVLSGADMDRILNGFDTRAETLLFGCLLAALPIARLPSFVRKFWGIPVAFLIGCLFFLGTPVGSRYEPTWEWKPLATFGLSLVAINAAWVLIVILEIRREHPIPFLSWRPVVFLGRISYGIYLWHFPICIVLGKRFPGPLNFLLTAITSVTVASASYYIVEKPALRLKARFNSATPKKLITRPREAHELRVPGS